VDREQFGTKAEASLTDSALDLLNRYIADRLTGTSRHAVHAMLADATDRHAAGIKDPQTAELCLEATKSVVRYLSISSGRRASQDTIQTLCERFMAEQPDLGPSHAYSIRLLARMPIGKRVASALTEEDLFDHARRRRDEGKSGATISQDLTFLRGVLIAARETWGMEDVSTHVLDRAKQALRKAGLIRQSLPRDRRPSREELQSLVDYFDTPNRRGKPRDIPMKDIMEFALWSARRISEICELRWDELDDKGNCKVRVTDARGNVREHVFPLLGKARDIVMRQPRISDRIFPYNSKSASASYTIAKRRIGIENLRFNDLRREAAIRLHEAGHSVEQIAKVTGRKELNSLLRDIGVSAAGSVAANEPATPRFVLEGENFSVIKKAS
jgi:integrase